jgi:hypothetical protein
MRLWLSGTGWLGPAFLPEKLKNQRSLAVKKQYPGSGKGIEFIDTWC